MNETNYAMAAILAQHLKQTGEKGMLSSKSKN